jgi:5-methylcytosine-specific restriction endonuclease McrA
MKAKQRKRSFRDAHRRMVGARQEWKCARCSIVLPSAFQVDHVVPLWRGGVDCVDNAEALCATCHAQKTQREEIERHEARRRAKIESAKEAQRVFEANVRNEELKNKKIETRTNGTHTCLSCGLHFYALFKHDTCPVIESRINRRINPPKPAQRAHAPNPFERFRHGGS